MPTMIHIPQIDEQKINELGCRNWPIWTHPEAVFDYTYDENEHCLFLEGEVVVTSQDGQQSVRIVAGDLITFPKGLSCTWDIKQAVKKHYLFF